MFVLNRNVKDMYLNTETLISLFDCYVGNVLNCGSSVWDINTSENIEKLHLDFCKRVLC